MQFYDLYNEGRDIDSVLKDLVGIALTSDESNKVVGFQPKGGNRIGHFNLTNGGGGGTVDANEDEIILGNGIGEAPKGAEVFLKKGEDSSVIGSRDVDLYNNFFEIGNKDDIYRLLYGEGSGYSNTTQLVIKNGAKAHITGSELYGKPEVFIHNNTQVNIDSGAQSEIPIETKGFEPSSRTIKVDSGSKVRIHDAATIEVDSAATQRMHDNSLLSLDGRSEITMHDGSLISLNGDAFIHMDGDLDNGPSLDMAGNAHIIANGGYVSLQGTDVHRTDGPKLTLDPNAITFSSQGSSPDLPYKNDYTASVKKIKQIEAAADSSELNIISKQLMYGSWGLINSFHNSIFKLQRYSSRITDWDEETKGAIIGQIKYAIDNPNINLTLEEVNIFLKSGNPSFLAYVVNYNQQKRRNEFLQLTDFNYLYNMALQPDNLKRLYINSGNRLYQVIKQLIDPEDTRILTTKTRYIYKGDKLNRALGFLPMNVACDDKDVSFVPSSLYISFSEDILYFIMEQEFFDFFYETDSKNIFFVSVDENGLPDSNGEYFAFRDTDGKREKTVVNNKIVGKSFSVSLLYAVARSMLGHATFQVTENSSVVIGGKMTSNPNPTLAPDEYFCGDIPISGNTYVRIGANATKDVRVNILNNSRVEVNDDSLVFINGNVNGEQEVLSTPENGSVLQLFNNSYFAMLGYDTINDSTKLAKIVPSDDVLGSPIFLMTGNSKLSLDKTAKLVLDNGSGIESTLDETTHTVSYDFSFGFNSEDKVTITKEDFEKLSTIPNFWFGTEAEYDALGTYDPHTIYMIEEG